MKRYLIIMRCLFVLAIGIIILLCPAPALASEQQGDTNAEESIKSDGAPVIIDGVELFTIKARMASVYPNERARLVTAKILEIAKDAGISVGEINITQNSAKNFMEITAGEKSIATVTSSDAEAEGMSLLQISEERREKIRQAVQNYRDSRRVQRLISQAIKVFLLTFILIFLFYLMRRAVKVHNNEKRPNKLIKIIIGRLIPARSVKKIFDYFGFSIILLLSVSLIYIYMLIVLSLFPWTIAYSKQLRKYAFWIFGVIGGGIWNILPNILIILAILFASMLLQKILRFFFDQIKYEKIIFAGFYADWADTTYRIAKFFIVVLTIIFVYPHIPGAQSAVFQGVSVLFGILVSIGSTSVISNIVAGIALTYNRSFRIGDRVKIGEHAGDIMEKSALSIRMRTIKNEEITIPNMAIVTSPVINYSSSSNDSALILYITVTLGYDVPLQTANDLLVEAAAKTPDILADPKPFVLQGKLNEFTVSYEINAFTDQPNKMAAIYSEMHKNIIDAFKGAGIDLNTPQQVVLRDLNSEYGKKSTGNYH